MTPPLRCAPDQPSANDPQYRDAMNRYDSVENSSPNAAGSDYTLTVTPNDGSLYVHVECQSCKEKNARIAELEAELKLSREQTEYANEAMWGMVAEHKNELALRLEAEAELVAMTTYRDNAKQHMEWLTDERDEARAELVALRARRCETCAYGNHSPICPMFGRNFDPDGFCHRWEAKP